MIFSRNKLMDRNQIYSMAYFLLHPVGGCVILQMYLMDYVLFYQISGCVVYHTYPMDYFPFHQVRRCAMCQTYPMKYFVSPGQKVYSMEYFLFYQVSGYDLSDIFYGVFSNFIRSAGVKFARWIPCIICSTRSGGYDLSESSHGFCFV